MARVIMTANDLVSRAKKMASRKTFYKNKWPYNLCYVHNDGRTSADCVNLYKSLFNGYDVNNTTKGYYQKDLSNTGDCTEWGLLSQCTDISQDFSKLKNGEPRILYMKGHIGGYVGSFYKDGYYFNVVECTGSWGGGILCSWVDPDGTRRRMKDGGKNGRWTHHGLPTKWVSYDGSVPAPEKKDYDKVAEEIRKGKYGNDPGRRQKLKAEGYTDEELKIIYDKVNKLCNKPNYTVEYTVKKGDILSAIAQRNGTTVNAIMKLNPQIKNKDLIYPGQVIRIK